MSVSASTPKENIEDCLTKQDFARIKGYFNNSAIYLDAVIYFSKKYFNNEGLRISVEVYGKEEEPTLAYTSFNNTQTGKIEKVEKGSRIHRPHIIGKIKEKHLLEILKSEDQIIAHPYQAIAEYAPAFVFENHVVMCTRLVGYLAHKGIGKIKGWVQ